jgi:putative transposase
MLVDTGGLVVKALVHAAASTDRQGGQPLLEGMGAVATAFPRRRYRWVDAAYQGSFKEWVEQTLHGTVDVVKRPSRWVRVKAGEEPPPMPTGFHLVRRRWVVERTCGGLGRWRRLSKDDEYLPATAACDIYLAMIRVLLRRLAESSTGRLLRCPPGRVWLSARAGAKT